MRPVNRVSEFTDRQQRPNLLTMKPLITLALLLCANGFAATIPALIIDGHNNHDYKATTPHLKKVLEETGLFTVDVR
jgi:uncharacterized protein